MLVYKHTDCLVIKESETARSHVAIYDDRLQVLVDNVNDTRFHDNPKPWVEMTINECADWLKVVKAIEHMHDKDGDLYAGLKYLGVEIDHNSSDLQFPHTRETMILFRFYKYFKNDMPVHFNTFTNQVDGTMWCEVAFAYTPFWAAAEAATE